MTATTAGSASAEGPLRVLLSIHHTLDAGTGAPGSTVQLGRALEAGGQDVRFLSFDDLPGSASGLFSAVTYPYFAATRLARAARAGLDVVDASAGDAWLWGRLRGRGTGPVLVTRSHGLEHLRHERDIAYARRTGQKMSWRYPIYHGGWRLREVRSSMIAADLVLVLNEEEREYLVERFSIPAERIELTANGVRDGFLAAARVTADGPGGPAIAVIGAYRTMKGVEHGASALTAVLDAKPEARISFFGTDVPRERVLEDFEPRVHDRVSVTESYARDRLPELLRGHSIFFFPTLSEGFSLALVEAMACGLCPVASDISGNRRLVLEGQNGLLVSPGDAGAASAAIQELLDDPPRLARFRAQARNTSEEFSWEKIATKTVALYREAFERSGRKPRK